jgi:hypothetical protein
LPTAYTGAAGLKQTLEQNLAKPLALASGDFDEDGVPDLVSGYAGQGGGILTVHRGNPETQDSRPKTQDLASQSAIHNPQSAIEAPFLSPAKVFDLPEAPEFLGAGDFDGDDYLDVVIAARGSNVLYWLPGNGQGSLGSTNQIELPGAVTTLVTGGMNRRDGLMGVAVGINGPDGPELLIFEWLRGEPKIFGLPAEATALALGQLDDDYRLDLVVAAGHELLILYGRDWTIAECGMRNADFEEEESEVRSIRHPPSAIRHQYSFPFVITSLALGDFIWEEEHRTEIALLSDNGSVHLLERREGEYGSMGVWADTELSLNAHTPTRPHAHSLLVRAKLSSLPTDDLVVLDPSSHQLHIISDLRPQTSDLRPNQSAIRNPQSAILAVNGPPAAVLPMRLNADALSDLVILKQGQNKPSVLLTAPMATLTVTNTSDGGAGSLRQAILDANANPGLDEIRFTIGSGAQAIAPASALPTITDPVVIDGTTQPGFAGTPIIELDGSKAGLASGLTIAAGHSTVRGLVINRYGGDGIELVMGGGNIIEGCFIGTDVSGTADLGNAGSGVFINSSPGNTIGGTTLEATNVISGNDEHGVFISGSGATRNQVLGNFIGTRADDANPLGNAGDGVFITAAASNNIIGGTISGADNIIAFNGDNGVFVADGAGNAILSNSIFANLGLAIDLGPDGETPNDPGDGDRGPNELQNAPELTSVSASGDSLTIAGTLNSRPNTTFRLEFFSTLLETLEKNSPSALPPMAIGGETVNLPTGHHGSLPPMAIGGDTASLIAIDSNQWRDRQPTPKARFAVNPLTAVSGKPSLGSVDVGGRWAYRLPSAASEGEVFLGAAMVTTNSKGSASFNVTFAETLSPGAVVTVTATDPNNNTSEFSQYAAAAPAGTVS